MQKWEYRVHVGRPTEDVLNAAGEQGWELVTVTPLRSVGSEPIYSVGNRPEYAAHEIFCVFKREKSPL